MKKRFYITTVGLIIGLMASGPALARGELVSSHFDGIYTGAVKLTAGSDPAR